MESFTKMVTLPNCTLPATSLDILIWGEDLPQEEKRSSRGLRRASKHKLSTALQYSAVSSDM